MKKSAYFFAFICTIAFTFSSCDKDSDLNEDLGGDWIWVKSFGGFGGWTITPETEGYTQRIIIDDFDFKRYVDDSLAFHSSFEFVIRSDSFFGTNQYLRFESGGEMAIKLTQDEMELYELCADCYEHTYVRE